MKSNLAGSMRTLFNLILLACYGGLAGVTVAFGPQWVPWLSQSLAFGLGTVILLGCSTRISFATPCLASRCAPAFRWSQSGSNARTAPTRSIPEVTTRSSTRSVKRGSWWRAPPRVTAANGSASLAYRARIDPGAETSTCVAGTREAFLLERYTAFTHRGQMRRRFDVWHRPWSWRTAEGHIERDSLLCTTGRWLESARLLGGHYSPGFDEVWMGRPRTIRRR